MVSRVRRPSIGVHFRCLVLVAGFFFLAPRHAFLKGPVGRQPRQEWRSCQRASLKTVPPSITEEELRAAFRLPQKTQKPGDRQGGRLSVAPLTNGMEMNAAKREALRLDPADRESTPAQQLEDEHLQRRLREEEAIRDGSAVDSFGVVYTLFVASVIWTWINNFYRIWELGHPPEPPHL
eukprot:TRINITY_DN102750_c0_g1_i1.p1 TRINITY_DN102750_c0_g1~~TRINITY_DN102750_c0_g1_i1.p1  ORF type:complete len:195 (-),score=27.12 TRINITY_DN102750_c0_g1_i1:605-1141(-)